MKMKTTRILALAATALMTATMASCAGKTETVDTTVPADTTSALETIAENTTAQADLSVVADDTTVETPSEEATVPDTETAATTASATEAPTETTAADTTTTTEAAPKAPTDKAEILKLYNDATAKVAQKKVAFSKRRETKEGVYKAGIALNAFKGIVYKFMGIGAENVYTKDVPKGDGDYSHYFQASKLTASDISDATCTLGSDGSYSITIKVKSGSSHIEGGNGETLNAPIDKCGISAGRNDKGYWDHKTAQNVYDAIDDVASGAVIDESYSDATVTATVDKDGNLTKLDVSFSIVFDIDKVYGSNGHATGTTVVNFTGFKW